jgi:hypothetical protein
MAERAIDSTLRTSLINNDSFVIIHLVKFERPTSSTASGGVTERALDYVYLTDSPSKISWDDLSKDSGGTDNGPQDYIPNKIISVGSVQESIEARATTMSIKLAASALGASVTDSFTTTSTYIEGDVDLAEIGFREGDKVSITGGTNDGEFIRVDSFSSEGSSDLPNTRMYFSSENTLSGETASITLEISSEELANLILSKESTVYTNYINREVFIYRAHINPTTGVIIGAPFLLFKGITSQTALDERIAGVPSISWGITSHWGDFIRIQGRRTSDSHHRALSITGKPDPEAIIRQEYATDYGFMHSEQSVNVLATYQAQELRYKTKKRGGLAGWLGGKKVVEYYETVDRDVDLRFNLSAKYLPVVYGVQKVSNIPIFADVEKNTPSEFYAVFALCEGEIGGIYDIHIDGYSSVCIDDLDFDARERDNVLTAGGEFQEGKNVDIVCYGRADEGYVLSGSAYRSGSSIGIPYISDLVGRELFFRRSGGVFNRDLRQLQIGTSENTTALQGLTHEQSYSFEIPMDATFITHTGKADQEADSMLVDLAANETFKIQSDYFKGDPAEYWSSSHRLLDTGYVSGKFTISEGEETIPDYEFVVKGKYIDCKNYDHSFVILSGDPSSYNIGDTVSLSVSGGGSHSNVTIIDKFTLYDSDGNADVRFRWLTDYPNTGDTLVNLGSGTVITMTGSGPTITMRTYDHVTSSGTVTSSPTDTAVSSSYSDAGGGLAQLTLTTSGSSLVSAISAAGAEKSYIAFSAAPESSFGVLSASGTTITLVPYSGAEKIISEIIADPTVSNTIFLSNYVGNAGGSAGDEITISRTVDNKVRSVTAKIDVAAGGGVFVGSPFYEFIPTSGDSFSCTWGKKDYRVSINPAMQALDYITSDRYGKGLDEVKDLNLDTWLESARLCDDRSKITVVSSTSPEVGAVYEIVRGDSSLIFRGTVSSVTSRTYSGTKYEIVFDACIGKLGYKWNNWRSYTAGDLVWYNDEVRTATAGKISDFSTLSTTTVTLTKVSGGGAASLPINISNLGGLTNSNPICRSWNTADSAFSGQGYSLHDSDDVKYWKYIGWDEPEQRYVTRHQMNQVVNTNVPLFDNLNSMLKQFNGILRYSNGKYELDIKTAAPSVFTDGVDRISEDDIIGNIKIDDKGQKNSFNSIDANIVDPQNLFAARSISYFDSNFLKEDKGVPKSGNFSLPGISNYYTARTNIVQFLKESRYGLNITMTLDPKAYLLLAGKIIAVNYSKFNWVDKLFRIQTLTIKSDGMVNVVAKEHNDDAYLIDHVDRDLSYNPGGATPLVVLPPTGLAATSNLRGEIELTWTNSARYNPVTYEIEIWATEAAKDSAGDYIPFTDTAGDPLTNTAGDILYTGNDFTNAVLLDDTTGDRYVHSGLSTGSLHVYFYWIRYVIPSLMERKPPKYSAFEPLSTGDGVQGIATSGNLDAITLVNSNQSHTFPADTVGNVLSYANSGTRIRVFEGATELDYVDGAASIDELANGEWSFENIDAIDLNTPDPIESTSGLFALVPDHAGMTDDVATITYQIMGRRVLGQSIENIETTQSFTLAKTGIDGDQGAAGIDEKAVQLTSDFSIIVYDENEINPAPDIGTTSPVTLTATSQNVADPYFRFTGDGINPDETLFVQGTAQQRTISWPSGVNFPNYFNTAKTIQVEVADGSTTGPTLAFDTISIAAVHPGTDGANGVGARGVSLSAPTQGITYDTQGLNPEHEALNTAGELTITASPYNHLGTPYYRFLVDDVEQQNTTSNTYQYTPPADVVNMPDKIEVELREDSPTGDVVARDQMTMYGLHYGSDAITIIMSNEAHPIPDDIPNPDMTGTGTTIKIYEGAFLIPYDEDSINSAGTDVSGPRRWDFNTITAINITESAPQEAGGAYPDTYCNMPDHISWDGSPGELQGSVTYEIVGQRFDGSIFTAEKVQSFSLSTGGGEDSRNVNLTAPTLAIEYDESGANPTSVHLNTAGALPLTATSLNTGGTPYYEFICSLGNTINPVQNTTTNTYDYYPDPQFADMPETITVKLREDGPANAVLAEDIITVIGLRATSNAVVGSMPNSAHILPADEDGNNVNYTGSGTDIHVYEGINELTYDNAGTAAGTYDVTPTVVQGTIAVGSLSTHTTGKCVVADHSSMTTDFAQISFDITGTALDGTTSFSFSLIQSLSKGKQGLVGPAGAQGSNGVDGRTVTISANRLALTYDVADALENPTVQDPVTLTAKPRGFSGTEYFEWYVDDALQGAAHVASNTDGTDEFELTGTDIDTFSDMPKKVEVAVYEGAGPPNPIEATDEVMVVGLKAGSDGYTVSLSNSAHTIPTDAGGVSPYMTGSGTTIKVWKGATALNYGTGASEWTVSAAVTYGPITVIGGASGTGLVRTYADHTMGGGFTPEKTAEITYTITIRDSSGTPLPETLTALQTFSRSEKGLQGDAGENGTDGATVILTNEAHTIPARSDGQTNSGDYVNSGTDIYFYYGNSALTCTTGALAAGEWKVISVTDGPSPTDIEADKTATANGTKAEFGDITGMSDSVDTAYVDYGVQALISTSPNVYVPSSGTIVKRMSFSKSKEGDLGQDGKAVSILPSSNVIRWASGTPESITITLDTQVQGFTTPYYQFAYNKGGAGWTNIGTKSTTSSRNLPSAGEPAENNKTVVRVQVSEGSGGAFEAEDQETIYAVTDGGDGQSIRTVNLYKLNDDSIGTPTDGTFANPLSGMEVGWGYDVPGLTVSGDKVYVITRTFTSDGQSPQDASWTDPPVIYSERQDGVDGQDGGDITYGTQRNSVSTFAGGTGTAKFKIDTDGVAYVDTGSGFQVTGITWHIDTTNFPNASDFDVTHSVGDAGSTTYVSTGLVAGTWYTLTEDRIYHWTATSTTECNYDVFIRRNDTNAVLSVFTVRHLFEDTGP